MHTTEARLCAYYVLIICLLFAYYVLIICLLFAYYLLIMCLLFAYYLLIMCLLFAYYLLIMCLLFAYYVLIICLLSQCQNAYGHAARLPSPSKQNQLIRHLRFSSGLETQLGGGTFIAPFQPKPEAHPLTRTMGTGCFFEVNWPGRGTDLPYLLSPRLKKPYNYKSTPFFSSMTFYRVKFTFTLPSISPISEVKERVQL